MNDEFSCFELKYYHFYFDILKKNVKKDFNFIILNLIIIKTEILV